jgi:DNA-binding transcriptional MerR regulator
MSRSQLARHVGVTRITIWNWERTGMLPAGERVSGARTIFGPNAIAAAELLAGAGA